MTETVADLPGYRRRIRIEPQLAGDGEGEGDGGAVTAMLEDDIHCMTVTLRHAQGLVTHVEPIMHRAPWTTCPGAVAQLIATFTGQPLAEVTARRDKRSNCTHLHDLAVFAAAHARAARALVYDVAVSDPVAGERWLELWRDGVRLLRWHERDGVLVEPAGAAGLSLQQLRDWIAALPAEEHEPARLLQWAGMVAHGRTIPFDQQSDARAMPASCYTFQPERAGQARRIGQVRDFNDGVSVPLDGVV